MNQSPLSMMREGGMTVAKICQMLDLSLMKTRASLLSLKNKGIIDGYSEGSPDEIITLTQQGKDLSDRMFDDKGSAK
jgi:predicted transcriptional regulator